MLHPSNHRSKWIKGDAGNTWLDGWSLHKEWGQRAQLYIRWWGWCRWEVLYTGEQLVIRNGARPGGRRLTGPSKLVRTHPRHIIRDNFGRGYRTFDSRREQLLVGQERDSGTSCRPHPSKIHQTYFTSKNPKTWLREEQKNNQEPQYDTVE